MITLSGCGDSSPMTAKAFSRLVPSCGTTLRSSLIAPLSAAGSLASSHLPALPGTNGFAWVLKP